MEPRKIQKVGYSTLSVSLPMSWAKKTGLKKGDLVFISEESDGALRITPEQSRLDDKQVYVVNVDQCDNTRVLSRVIVGNYVLGRSLIRVESQRRLIREQIEAIREVTRRLIGIGIIEESETHLLLQCSVDPKNFPIKECLDALIDRDMELAKDALAREQDADTIFWLMIRLLSLAQQNRLMSETIGITSPLNITQFNMIAWYLEMIGDRLYDVARIVMAIDKYRRKEEEDLFERLSQIGLVVFNMFDQAMKSLFTADIKQASDAVDLYEAVGREEESLLREFQENHDPVLAAHVNEIAWELRIISEYSTAIATTSIDKVIWGENDICSLLEEPQETEEAATH